MSIYEDMMKNARKNAVREGKTSFELDVICPYCGESHDDYQDNLTERADEWASIDCQDCEKTFEVKWTAEYHTRKDTIGIVKAD